MPLCTQATAAARAIISESIPAKLSRWSYPTYVFVVNYVHNMYTNISSKLGTACHHFRVDDLHVVTVVKPYRGLVSAASKGLVSAVGKKV